VTQSDTGVRLDIWLDVACLFRTRSEAQRACTGGKVEVNGQRVKPHRLLHVGDQVALSRPLGRKQTIVVVGLADKHVPKAEAKALYNDTTPPMPEAEREMRRLERLYRAGLQSTHAPDKRERRELRKLKGKE
jgi:ribosome-associated heat shock protein Hsp15